MKTLIKNIFTRRNSSLDLACGLVLLLLIGLGCGGSGNTNPEAEAARKKALAPYLGTWTAQDGSTLTLRADESGDYKSGGSSITNGKVEVDEAAKEIRFTMLGAGVGKYKIDSPPANNKMTLDGMEYRRTGGFTPDDSTTQNSSNSNSNSSSQPAPSEDEMLPIVTATIQDFDAGLERGDFSDLYAHSAKRFKDDAAPDAFDKAFAGMAPVKADYKLKTGAPLTLTSKPAFGQTALEITGTYPTPKNKDVAFQLKYVKEDNTWKLVGINISKLKN